MPSKLRTLGLVFLLLPFQSVWASSFSQIVAFGDSLSDGGDAFLYGGGSEANYGIYNYSQSLQPEIYTDGTNTTPKAAGPGGMWLNQLAPKLHVAQALPSFAGGTNYAFGGAETGTGNFQIGGQVAEYERTLQGTPAAGTLFTIWGGANDIIGLQSPTTAADNISSYIDQLHGLGGQTFLWPNLPLLGDTPAGKPFKDLANAATLAFNAEWAKDVAQLQGAGVHVIGLDVESLFAKILGNPGAYGFSNVDDPAMGTSGATDAGYLFWDDVHPTSAGHALVADAAFDALSAAPAPEPASMALAFLGFSLLVIVVIRRRVAKAQ